LAFRLQKSSVMKMRDFSHTTVGLWCALFLIAAAVHACEVSGVSMPDEVNISGRVLRLNGMGVRKEKLLFKAYVIGLYLETPTVNAEIAISTDEGKRIVLQMLRDASRDQFVDAVETGVMRNSGPVMPVLRARLDLLEHALPALKQGNIIDLTYLPDIGTLVRGQGQEMRIPGKDFADALFSVWLGPKPLSVTLKRQLMADGSGCAGWILSHVPLTRAELRAGH
jgi:hypothetical protein